MILEKKLFPLAILVTKGCIWPIPKQELTHISNIECAVIFFIAEKKTNSKKNCFFLKKKKNSIMFKLFIALETVDN